MLKLTTIALVALLSLLSVSCESTSGDGLPDEKPQWNLNSQGYMEPSNFIDYEGAFESDTY